MICSLTSDFCFHINVFRRVTKLYPFLESGFRNKYLKDLPKLFHHYSLNSCGSTLTDFLEDQQSKNYSMALEYGSTSSHRARKSRTTLQNKVRLKVLPEQLTLFVNTSVTFKKMHHSIVFYHTVLIIAQKYTLFHIPVMKNNVNGLK